MSTPKRLDEWCLEESRNFHAKNVDELSDEAFISFAETVLESIYYEIQNTLRRVNGDIDSDTSKEIIAKMERFLISNYYNAISMGHGLDTLEGFRRELELIRKGEWKNGKKILTEALDLPIAINGKFNSTRDKMKAYRLLSGKSFHELAQYCQCSEGLLRLVEHGSVTHPTIAKRIGAIYKLSKKEIEDLVPVHYRPSSPEYDPDKYKNKEDGFQKFSIGKHQDPVDQYISERRNKAIKQHEQRGYY